MSARHLASITAVLGGLAWVVAVALRGPVADAGGSSATIAYAVGLVLLAVAAGAGGYTLVERAPLWLRAVVVLAAPLLLFTAVTAVDEAVEAVASEGWFAAEVTVLLTALAAGVAGAVRMARLGRPAASRGRGTAAR